MTKYIVDVCDKIITGVKPRTVPFTSKALILDAPYKEEAKRKAIQWLISNNDYRKGQTVVTKVSVYNGRVGNGRMAVKTI